MPEPAAGAPVCLDDRKAAWCQRDHATGQCICRPAVGAPGTDVAYDPPATFWIEWCPVCGRDDRFQPFTGKSHFSRNGRCKGQPVRVTYSLAERRDA